MDFLGNSCGLTKLLTARADLDLEMDRPSEDGVINKTMNAIIYLSFDDSITDLDDREGVTLDLYRCGCKLIARGEV
jgi:hypothetical protein